MRLGILKETILIENYIFILCLYITGSQNIQDLGIYMVITEGEDYEK